MTTVKIIQHPNPESPRTWDCNIGKIYLNPNANRSLNFGDEVTVNQNPASPDWKGYIALPLYIYDHGIAQLSVDPLRPYPFNCQWDSAQIGIYAVSYEKLQEVYEDWENTEEWRKRVKDFLAEEIKELNQWLRGDVWGYEIEHMGDPFHEDDENYEDSCWGFFGADPRTNGMFEHVPERFRPLLVKAYEELSQ